MCCFKCHLIYAENTTDLLWPWQRSLLVIPSVLFLLNQTCLSLNPAFGCSAVQTSPLQAIPLLYTLAVRVNDSPRYNSRRLDVGLR